MRSEEWNLLTASAVSGAVIIIFLFLFQIKVFYAFATKFLAVELGPVSRNQHKPQKGSTGTSRIERTCYTTCLTSCVHQRQTHRSWPSALSRSMGVGDIDLAKCEWIGNRIWVETIGPFMIYMILIIGNGRWIVRPAISGEGIGGYGLEMPVDARQSEAFTAELKQGEL